ncbi:hypothetical protein O5265_04830 [Escherichia coli]|nr:hypothetical protein [Escherichia coli]
MHHLAEQGAGYRVLAKEAAAVLTGDEFWAFIDKLATGRRLVITADHGYSNPALFPDVYPEDQKAYLKGQFKSGTQQRSGRRKNRTALGTAIISGTDNTAWQLEHCAGPKKMAFTRRLSKLGPWWTELVRSTVPFIELSKPNN